MSGLRAVLLFVYAQVCVGATVVVIVDPQGRSLALQIIGGLAALLGMLHIGAMLGWHDRDRRG